MPENLVEHAVITDPNAVGVLGGSQLLVAVWKWIPSKGFDGPDDFYDITRGIFRRSFLVDLRQVIVKQTIPL